MKVCVAVKGRFHAFELARELQLRGALARLITSYPARAAAAAGIERGRVRSVLSAELLSRLAARLPEAARRAIGAQPRLHDYFDRRAAQAIDPAADVFIGWSGVCLRSLREAKRLGLLTVVERGSCHIERQHELLSEEREIVGRPIQTPHPAVIERELCEYAEADFIQVPGSFARASFVQRGVPADKLLVAPYGVQLAHYSPAPRPPATFRVLYCGAVSAQKGVHYLLEACAAIDVELWLVGPVLAELAPLVARHRSPRLRVFGRQPGSALPDLYRRCSAFCLPSIQDGMGLVLLQAMASGLPIVATGHTGAPDLIESGREGFVVPIRDVAAIARALLLLRDDPQRCQAMGAAAAQRAAHGFAWHDYGERVMANLRHARVAHRPARRAASRVGA